MTNLHFLQFSDHALTERVNLRLRLLSQLNTLSLVSRNTGLGVVVMGREGRVDRSRLFGNALTAKISAEISNAVSNGIGDGSIKMWRCRAAVFREWGTGGSGEGGEAITYM